MGGLIGSMPLLGGTLRLVAALVVGAVIGMDRQLREKAAGLRTHTLVAPGSATMMVVAVGLGPGPDSGNESRVIQGIITGIGFLGAGVILRPSGQLSVHVLTTAATIWIAAGLGIACGAGRWAIAVVATVLTVTVLVVGQAI